MSVRRSRVYAVVFIDFRTRKTNQWILIKTSRGKHETQAIAY